MKKHAVRITIFVVMLVVFWPFLSSGSATHPEQQTVWTVSGRTILLNGTPFFVTGVNYSPAPVGGSFNWSPYGDWFTGEWHEIHERDFPRLREIQANSIRVHSWFAFEPSEANYERYGLLDFAGSQTKDHTDFLDKAWNGGKDPLYVLITIPLDKVGLFDAGEDKEKIEHSRDVYGFYTRTTLWMARKYGKHPAVMGFLIGNECNDRIDRPDRTVFGKRLSELARIVKSTAPDKLVGTAWFPQPKEHFMKYPDLLLNTWSDFIGINLYNGPLTYEEFWRLYRKQVVGADAEKPVLVTEFGTPACVRGEDGQLTETQESVSAQDRWVMHWWKEIVAHSVMRDAANGITSGGYVFAWSDEWWKTEDRFGHAARRDPGFIRQDFLAGGLLHDECFGIHSVTPAPGRPPFHPWDRGKNPSPYPADRLTPRSLFGSLKKAWTELRPDMEKYALSAVPRARQGKGGIRSTRMTGPTD
jgi:hypothetical protein